MARCEMRLRASTGRKKEVYGRHLERVRLVDGWGHLAGAPPIVLNVSRELHSAMATLVLEVLGTPGEAYLELVVGPMIEQSAKDQLARNGVNRLKEVMSNDFTTVADVSQR
jgi:hypothetical protein